ncbi:MAG: ComF family protein [Eubacteriales bacterium]|nr:ComF family protein [Eubacteriales bacterium]
MTIGNYSVIDLLFPRRCPVCGDIVQPQGALICPACLPKLSPVRQPACRKCGKEVVGEHAEYCPDCMRHQRSFESGVALFNYNEAARASMVAVKYKNRREYLDFYAEAADYRFRRTVAGWQADALIPVPVHPSRRRTRGFNQAEELAKRLGRRWKIPVETELLIRCRKTAPQRELNPQERLKNLQKAFAVHPSGAARGSIPQRVILVDDIYTTGSTMEACTRVLKEAGVQEVHFIVLCIGEGR